MAVEFCVREPLQRHVVYILERLPMQHVDGLTRIFQQARNKCSAVLRGNTSDGVLESAWIAC